MIGRNGNIHFKIPKGQRKFVTSPKLRVLPAFYINIQALAEPDYNSLGYQKELIHTSKALVLEYGNWEEVNSYMDYMQNWLKQNPGSLAIAQLTDLQQVLNNLSSMQVSPAVVEEIKKRITAITEESSSWKTLVPVMYLSTENKLHYWLFGGSKYLNGETSSGLLRGDLGYSLVSGKKVTTERATIAE